MEMRRPDTDRTHRFVVVRGTPYEMGRQRVNKLGGLVETYIRSVLPDVKKDIEDRKLQPTIDKFKDAMENQAPELLEEMRGIADAAEVSFDDVVGINFFDGIPAPDWKLGGVRRTDLISRDDSCTAFGAAAPATADGLPIVGKVWGCKSVEEERMLQREQKKWDPMKVRLIIWKIPKDGIPHVQDSSPSGSWGEDGMNEKGLAILGGGVRPFDGADSFEKGNPVGLPVHFMNHVIMEHCENIDEAVEYLKRTPKGYLGRNQLVVHWDNIIRAETSWGRCNITWPDVDAHYPSNYVMAAANHFPSKEMNQLAFNRTDKGYISSYLRYERAKDILVKNAGHVSFELIKKIARDHVNGPSANSICRHGTVFSGGSMILQPAWKRVWVLSGNPCINEWTPYTLQT